MTTNSNHQTLVQGAGVDDRRATATRPATLANRAYVFSRQRRGRIRDRSRTACARALLFTALITFLAVGSPASSSGADIPSGKALETRDRSIREQFEAAMAAYADAEFVLAERRFRELADRVGIPDGDRQIFSFMVGKCLYAQGEYTFALRHFDRFRDQFHESPHAAAARIISGHCAYRTGDLPAAAREYTLAISEGPEAHRRIALSNLEPLARRGLSLRGLEAVLADLTDDPGSAPVRFWIAERWAASGRRLDAVEQYLITAALAVDTALARTARERAVQLEHPDAWSLVVGVLAPLSGDFAPFGNEVEAAALMASDRWGQTVRVVIVDTRGDPVRAAWAADSLVDIGCHAVIGPLRTECVTATVAVFRAHDVVQLLPVARRGGDELTGMAPRLFVLSVPPDGQARQLLHTAMTLDGMRRFAVFAADTPGGRAAARAFVTAALVGDATVYPIQYFPPATLDFSRSLRTLKRIIRDDRDEPLPTPSEIDEMERQRRLEEKDIASEVETPDLEPLADEEGEEDDKPYDLEARWRVELDGILIWADPEDIRQIVPQARALGYSGRFLGNAGWGDPTLGDALASEMDSVLFVSDEQIDDSRLEWRTFASDFRGRFGRVPGWLAARTYDAIGWLAQQAIDTPDPLHPLKRLSVIDEFDGVIGTYRFGPGRQRDEAGLYRYIHGRPTRLALPVSVPASSPE